jgi:hypothetical protein
MSTLTSLNVPVVNGGISVCEMRVLQETRTMVTRRQIRAGSARGARRRLWLTLAVMPCICVAFVLADERPDPPKAAPALKKVEAKKAAAKPKKVDTKPANKKDEQDKKAKKSKAPPGYEDAPQAGDLPEVRDEAEIVVQAMEADGAEAAGLEQILEVKVDANVANIEKQFIPQFKPLLTAELSFIHRVCDLNLEQRKKIHAASDKCLQAAVRKYAVTQNMMMRGGLGRVQRTSQDPTVLLHLALAEVLNKTLQPEQRTAYDNEMALRKAYRQRAAIENVVALIDERLVLTIDQRQKLTESLNKNWQASWVQSIEMLINNNQYLPSIPDQFVVSALNDTQKKVWRAAQKQNFMVWGGFGWGQQVGAVDDFPLVEVQVGAEKTSVN